MTRIDRTSLDHVLPPAVGSADWDDVMARAGIRPGRRPRRVVTLVAAALVVAVGTASAFAAVRALMEGRVAPRITYVQGGELYLVEPDGGDPQRLVSAPDCCFAWAPDDTWAAYSLDGGIWLVRADGSARRRLTSEGSFPAWSPNGRSIAYSDGDGISVVKTNGTGRRTVAAGGTVPRWSPEGRRIAFTRRGDVWVARLPWRYDASGASVRARLRNLTDSPEAEADVSWSPDGRSLLFVRRLRRPTAGGAGLLEIVRANADGGQEQRLTSTAVYDGRASWSPDGRRIVFVCGSSPHVCVMNGDGSGRRQLGVRPADDGAVAWSPDGTTIAYTTRDGAQVGVVEVDGSKRRLLTRSPGGSLVVAWSYGSERRGYLKDWN